MFLWINEKTLSPLLPTLQPTMQVRSGHVPPLGNSGDSSGLACSASSLPPEADHLCWQYQSSSVPMWPRFWPQVMEPRWEPRWGCDLSWASKFLPQDSSMERNVVIQEREKWNQYTNMIKRWVLKASSSLDLPTLGCPGLPWHLSSSNKSPFLPRLVQVQFPTLATKSFLTKPEASLPHLRALSPPPGHVHSWDPAPCSAPAWSSTSPSP